MKPTASELSTDSAATPAAAPEVPQAAALAPGQTEAAVAEAPAPKRRRAPRKTAAVAAPADEVRATLSPQAAVVPLQVERDAVPLLDVPQAPSTVTPADAATDDVPAREPASAQPGDESMAGQPAGETSRRGRNRRRGRRGGRDRERERGDTPEGVSEDLAPVAVALPLPSDAGEVFAQLLNGEFDDDAEPSEAPTKTKRVLRPEPDAPKLHKVLAQAGIGSRRDMEQLIVEGRVTVNGEPAHTGQRISFGDQLRLDGKPIKVRIHPPPARVLAYHKPAGEVVTHDDPQQRPTVFRRLPRLSQGKWQSVGRLDINTEGLLLFTNSGALANQLMHPRFGVEREYAVRVLGELSEEARARLLAGVEIDGQSAALKSIEEGGGEGANRWYRVVITEGRNREVRKLFEAVGHAVSRLIRIRYGSVVLPRGLRRGVWVDLDEADVATLRRLAGGSVPAPRGADATGDQEGVERGGRGRRGKGRNRDGGPRRAGPGPEPGEHGPIPNPLQQTYDKRAIQQARKAQREIGEDGPIPNPLQQTYDKRPLQMDRTPARDLGDDGPIPDPLQQTFDRRFAPKARPQARGGRKEGSAPRQPDPMQTSLGYIGADAFVRKSGRGGGRNRGGGGGGGRGSGGRGSGGGRGGRGG